MMVWTVIGLYLLFIVVLHIPIVQEKIGTVTAAAISQKLGTKVSIGKIDLGFFNRLIIDDAILYDKKGKKMVLSARLSVKLSILSFLKDGLIDISSAQIFGTHIRLYQATAQSQPNYQFVLDSLASKDTTTKNPIRLNINSFLIRHSSISYDLNFKPQTQGMLNPAHLKITDISANIQLKHLEPDSINLTVQKLACKEQAGMEVNKLSLCFAGGRNSCKLTDMKLLLPHSTLQVPFITLTYRKQGKNIDPQSLHYSGEIGKSILSSNDLVAMHSALKPLQAVLLFSARFTGNVQSVTVSSLSVTDSNNLSFRATGSFKKHMPRPLWNIDIKHLSISSDFISRIGQCLRHTPVQMPEAVKRLGDIRMKGQIAATTTDRLHADCHVTVNPGMAQFSFALSDDKCFTGSLHTDGLALDEITGNNKFGTLAATLDVSGNLKNSHAPVINAKGRVNKLHFNGYDYNNILLNGAYSSQGIKGQLSMDDPNATVVLKGTMQKNKGQNDINLTADFSHFCPSAMRLTNKWGDSQFKASIRAAIKGNGLNDAMGQLTVNDFEMKGTSQNYTLNHLSFNTGYHERQHYLTINSDFGHAELVGRFEYASLSESMVNFVRKQLPTLPGLPNRQYTTNNNFLVRAEINKTDWLERLLQVPLHADQPITLNGKINDKENYLYLNCIAPDIQFKDQRLRDITVAVTTPEKALHCDISATKVMDKDNLLKVSVSGTAHDNVLNTRLHWSNTADKTFSGMLNCEANFTTEAGQQTAHIDVKPSHINIGETQWEVNPAHITYRKSHIDVDNFEIRHDKQHLSVCGTASKSEADSLQINLNGIDVNYVLNLVNFHSVEFGGSASGRAYITAPFSDFGAKAQLTVNRFTFEGGRMGVLQADVEWNKAEKQIDIKGTANDGPEAMTYIDGYVSTSRSYIDLGIRADGTRLDFMRSFTKNFMNDIGGQARGEVRLIGPLSTINLTGQLVVDGHASITTTGCTYTLHNDTVNLIPDDILLQRAAIYDKDGNRGVVTGGIHHRHLTHLTYDLAVETNNMLVYDFKDFGENTFYGTVYGSGTVDIHGLSDELTMNVNITPRHNSNFVYNVSNPDDVSGQEFVKWHDVTLHSFDTSSQAANQDDGKTSSDTYINFLINMTPDATVKLLMDSKTNDYITLNGSGTLQATYYNKGTFNMYGTYRVNRGTYGITIQNIIKKNFLFNEGGTIVFRGNPYDAALNLQAVYTVNGVSLSDLNIGNSFSNNTIRVNCLMNITGQPAKPLVDFDLDMPTVSSDEKQMVRNVLNSEDEMNQQVLYLLGIGRFYPQGTNNATAQNERQQSQTSLAMQSLLSGTLSSQINNVLGQVIKSNNWNFGANISTGDEGWNNAEYEGLLSGRLLNNRLLINGQFGYRDNANTANTSFIGDFDIRYLLFPNGNMAIKMYNQTNDRYFTKSSLNTQGIGLIMKKDFTNLKDLFGLRNKKKKRQNK